MEFGRARVLDTLRLRQTWSAWFELTHAPAGPICAESTPLLLDLLRDSTGEPPPPYCALILAADARSRLARQSRHDTFLGSTPRDVAVSTGIEGWHFLAGQVDCWNEQPTQRRAVLVCVLTQLGFYGLAVRLVGEIGRPADGPGQYLAYEAARALRQHRRASDAPAQVFARLATEGTVPALRVLSCAQLISILRRDRYAPDSDRDWAVYGEGLLSGLSDTEPWLRALTESRFLRAAAFQRFGDKNVEGARQALEEAYAADADTERLAENPQQRHCARENRRLLADVTVKAGTRLSPPGRVQAAADTLLRLDGAEASSRFHVAALAQRGGDVRAAAEEFERGAQAGTLRGATAAYRAVRCWEELGDDHRADRAAHLLFDLDPAAHSPREPDHVPARGPAGAPASGQGSGQG
ncbi:hypothetical protein AS594_40015 [Streptomyces agglomeratus]|uniref:Uncharacterized protein n=1 Tax=Streptomyces agglomeratus TaxID=285458 RepID=A0A1E5NXP2_9ACTN|nr:hypothetical protein AS594_40015 [Streptomyces agglomeratus]